MWSQNYLTNHDKNKNKKCMHSKTKNNRKKNLLKHCAKKYFEISHQDSNFKISDANIMGGEEKNI